MSISKRLILALAASALALPAWAQVPADIVITDDCGGSPVVGSVVDAEVYLIQVPATGCGTDIQFDVSETRTGLADTHRTPSTTVGDAVNVTVHADANWQGGATISPTSRVVMIATYGETATGGNQIAVDSWAPSDPSSFWDAVVRQTVGNSLPDNALYNGAVPVGGNGIDLSLPGSSSTYPVRTLDDNTIPGTQAANFPFGASGGIEVAFAPVIEVNNNDLVGGGGCTIAGRHADPNDTAGTRGIIIGYNVYRVPGTAASRPTRQAFYDATFVDADASTGFQYFLPLTSFNLTTSDTAPPAPGTPAPTDTLADDFAGYQNPDGIPYSGDEVLIFQDSTSTRGGAGRLTGTGPDVTGATAYWYAFQPVICGTLASFGPAVSFGGNRFTGEHRMNLGGTAANDGVDLDLDGVPEFISPQADLAAPLPGLGLTYDGLPLLSAPVFGRAAPLAAGDSPVSLTARVGGSNVDITFQTGLEAGNVQGFNVYRQVGAEKVLVNTQPILAQGNESNVYKLVDDVTQARRLSRGGDISYFVEIVYSDGTASRMVGPFQSTVAPAAPQQREHRRR